MTRLHFKWVCTSFIKVRSVQRWGYKRVTSITPLTTGTITDPPENYATAILQNILASVVKTNVTGIVMVGLMIMFVILVSILTIWVVLFVQNYERGPNSRFYQPKPETAAATPKSPILPPNMTLQSTLSKKSLFRNSNARTNENYCINRPSHLQWFCSTHSSFFP